MDKTEIIEALQNIVSLADGLSEDDPWFGERRDAEKKIADVKVILGRLQSQPEQEEKDDLLFRSRIRKIINMTAMIDPDGTVYGMDTECGNIKNMIDSAIEILKEH